MVSLASELVPRMAFLYLLSNGCKVGRCACPASLSMLGVQTPILTLVQQARYHTETSPQPSPLLLKILLVDRILHCQVLKNNVALQIVPHNCLLIFFLVLENIIFLFFL